MMYICELSTFYIIWLHGTAIYHTHRYVPFFVAVTRYRLLHLFKGMITPAYKSLQRKMDTFRIELYIITLVPVLLIPRLLVGRNVPDKQQK